MKKSILSVAFLAASSALLVSCDPKDLSTKPTTGAGDVVVASTSTSNGNGPTTTINGEGEVVTNKVDLGNFEGITVDGLDTASLQVEVVLGDSFKVEVSDYKNLVEFTKSEVKDNQLVISKNFPANSAITTNLISKAVVTVPANQLKKLTVWRAGKLTLKDGFNGISEINTPGIRNMATITALAPATTTDLKVILNGTSNVDLSNVTVTNLDALTAGTSKSKFTVTTALKADLRGLSTLSYSGDPVVTRSQQSTLFSFGAKLIKL